MDNLTNAYIQQYTKKYSKDYTLVYTFIDDSTNYELWMGVKGYGKMVLLYGGKSKDVHETPLNLDYGINSDTIKEITGE